MRVMNDIEIHSVFLFVCFIPLHHPPILDHLRTASQSEAQKKLQPFSQIPVLQEQGEYSAGAGGDWTWVWARVEASHAVLHASSCHCHSPQRWLLIGQSYFFEPIRTSLAFGLALGRVSFVHVSQVWGCTNTQMLCSNKYMPRHFLGPWEENRIQHTEYFSEHSKGVLVQLHPWRALHLSQPLTNHSFFFLSALFVLAFTCRDAQDFPGLSDDFYGSKSLSKCVVPLVKQLFLKLWATHHIHPFISICHPISSSLSYKWIDHIFINRST